MTGTSRDIGLTGAGKGSRPRNVGTKAFNQNYDQIDFKYTPGAAFNRNTFTRRGNKLQKTYR